MDTPSSLSTVDTCVMISLAEHSRPAWQMVRQLRAQGIRFALSPTVVYELVNAADDHTNSERQRLALQTLQSIGSPPLQDFFPASLTGQQNSEIQTAAARLQREMLLPREEWHDTVIICEAAMLGCKYLLTNDTHLLGVPQPRLAAVLRQMGLPAPRIISYHSVLA